MTNQEKMDILMGIYNNLFQSKQNNTDITKVNIVTNMGTFPGRWFVSQTLRGFDVDINAGDKIVQIRCLEQNPNKTDNNGNLKPNANLARIGHKIMWVIDRKDSWLGRIQDGAWIPAFETATKPAPAYNYNTPEHEARVDAAYAHIEQDINDPNFHGIPGTSGTPMANLPIEHAMQQNLPEQPGAPEIPGQVSYGQSLAESIIPADTPEIPGNADIPEYVLQSVSEMEEPPDWGDYE
jgi:hypothetical protein